MREIHLKGFADWAHQGEHNAVALLVGASEFLRLWPNGVPQTIFRRADGATYPVPCALVDGAVRVVLTATEAAVAGVASLEVQWLDNSTVAKSVTYNGRINASLEAGDTPPDPPGQGWLDEVREIGAGVGLDRIAVSEMRGEVETLTAESRDIAQGVEADRDATHGFMERAEGAAEGAEGSEISAGQSSVIAAQALADLLAMITGGQLATLGPDGKLTPSQIPPISINDVFPVASTAEMLTLTAERGDTALVVAGGVVTDSYILMTDDPTVLTNWAKLGVSYVANAGHAVTADCATDAEKINGKRIISMTQTQYDVAEAGGTLDPATLYVVVPD